MMTAGQDLRGMVQTGLVEQTGFGRWTKYVLKVKDLSIDNSVQKIDEEKIPQTDEEKILAYVQKHASIDNTECRNLLGVDGKRAWYLLRKLTNNGSLKRQGEGRWSRYILP